MKARLRNMAVVGGVALAATLITSWAAAQSATDAVQTEALRLKLDQPDRTILPPPESPFKGKRLDTGNFKGFPAPVVRFDLNHGHWSPAQIGMNGFEIKRHG